MQELKLGFVGTGQMARALAVGFVGKGLLSGQQLYIYDPVEKSREQFSELVPGCNSVASNLEIVGTCDLVFLAVKPHIIAGVANEIRDQVNSGTLFISIATGVSLQQLSEGLGTRRVVRVMPNTPCLVGAGACGYTLGSEVSDADGERVLQMLQTVGIAFELPERLLAAVTGLSGSGPAYLFTIIEALSDGGVKMGLPRDVSTSLAVQTVIGSAKMVQESGEHPAILRERVTSPGGTTIAALHALEEHGLRAGLMAAVEASANRSDELGKM